MHFLTDQFTARNSTRNLIYEGRRSLAIVESWPQSETIQDDDEEDDSEGEGDGLLGTEGTATLLSPDRNVCTYLYRPESHHLLVEDAVSTAQLTRIYFRSVQLCRYTWYIVINSFFFISFTNLIVTIKRSFGNIGLA